MRKIFNLMTVFLLVMSLLIPCVSVSAFADSIADTAVSLESGEKQTGNCKTDLSHNIHLDYKIDVTKSGDLKLNFTSYTYNITFEVFDSSGNPVVVYDCIEKAGYIPYSGGGIGATRVKFMKSDLVDKSSGSVIYKVDKGTFYIRVRLSGEGKYSFRATYPTVEKAKINYLTLTVKKGTSLELSPIVTNGNSVDVIWKSSKPKVAAVSNNGKITAKAKGSTVISATAGKSTKKIKIIVK